MAIIPGIAPLMPLSSLEQINSSGSVSNQTNLGTKNEVQKAGTDFMEFLNNELQKVDALQKNADVASIALATGQTEDIHTVMIALEKASLSLGLTVEVRNKVLDAYNQIMRMQI
ncbi:MAG TPA: flagellar hook-basal body complex protein FliE [Desulfitobacteriaceae bacterium]|nr:flagellar hook-basal body complex protein FliE [Desulfitobacteriaceae bacterium]